MNTRASLTLACAVAGLIAFGGSAASAQSCYDLWYERNAIYDSYGYCFRTSLGRRTFDNSDCWTRNPRLSRADQNRVEQIRRRERRMGCKVN